MSSLSALRAQLATVVAPAPAVESTIRTGIPSLDDVLPGGGIPCGRLTEVAGSAGSGATSLARAVAAAAIGDRHSVAYIDASRTLAPADWVPLAASGQLWVVRPPTEGHGPWCADVLLRSGAFRLVVLDDTTPIPRNIIVRLSRLAQETRAALLVIHHQAAGRGLVGSALRLEMQRPPTVAPPSPGIRQRWRRVETRLVRAAHGPALAPDHPPAGEALAPAPPSHRTRHTFSCTISKGSGHEGPLAVEICCVNDLAHRLRADSAVPDRRGVATRNRLGERAAPDAPGLRRATPPPDGVGGTALPRKRRFAEPDVNRDGFLLDRSQVTGRKSPAGTR